MSISTPSPRQSPYLRTGYLTIIASLLLLAGILLPADAQITETKLKASDGAGDQFSHRVSIDGDTALIGAYLDDDDL